MTQTAPPIHDAQLCAPKARKYILLTAILASAMGFIDGSVVSIAMPSIRETIGATLAQAQWVSNAYMLTLSALILAGGAFGDRFGLARVFSLGIGLFVISSLACALAPDPEMLIAARLVQGVGAALMVPGSMAIIARAYPREERGRALGIWAASAAVTTAMGPILGGLALTFAGPEMWRAIFAINLPLGTIALWMLHKNVQKDKSQPGAGIDFRGALLATLGLGSIAFGLTELETGASGAVPPIVAGIAMFTLFIFWERVAPNPMLQLSLFRAPGFSATNLATFLLYTGFSGILFFLPMTLIAGWGIAEITSTLAFLPLSIFIGGLSTWSGKTAARIGAGPMIGSGAFLVALAFALLAVLTPYQNFWGHVLPAMFLMGLGMGLLVSPLSVAVMSAAPDSQSGAASGVNNAIARSAGLVAVAALGGIASIAYSSAGGQVSFGVSSNVTGHLVATNIAFQAVAAAASALALLASIVALFGIPKPSE